MKKERFTATTDSKGNIYLNRTLRNPIELDELVVFLKFLLVGGAIRQKKTCENKKGRMRIRRRRNLKGQ